jgi:hypothetical protein
MKQFIIIPVLVCLYINASAQTIDSSYKENNVTYNLYKHKSSSNQVIQSMGKYYNCNQLMKMPNRNINKIAATVAGVDSRNGETPIIRGAVGGTAYFIDGVRVYNVPSVFLMP